MSRLLGWGAYVRDKNISARFCAKKGGGGGGGLCTRGGVFAGHYGTLHVPLLQYIVELMLYVPIYSCIQGL